jgi:hypothetical protein
MYHESVPKNFCKRIFAMKKIARTMLLLSCLISSTAAFSQTALPTAGADNQASQGKTRAQVHAELIEAERAGVIPTSDIDYPASEETIRRNKELYRVGHKDQDTAG